MHKFRPFQLLKLIRDNKINTKDIVFMSSRDHHNYRNFLDGLQKLRMVTISKDGAINTTDDFKLLLNSLDISLTQLENYAQDSMIYQPIFGLPSNDVEKANIFMVMPFLDKLKPVYDDHIRKVAGELSLSIARGDDFFTSSAIISDIWNAITSCEIVIADCTGRNPNVFYEIGIAHTIGKPVIFISQNRDDIPFDIQYIRYIVYEYTPRGMSDFEKVLTSTIQNEVKKKMKLTNQEGKLPKRNA